MAPLGQLRLPNLFFHVPALHFACSKYHNKHDNLNKVHFLHINFNENIIIDIYYQIAAKKIVKKQSGRVN